MGKEEEYDAKQDVRDMLAEMMKLLTKMYAIYHTTRRRHIAYVGAAPTWSTFTRVLVFMESLHDALVEQMGVNSKR